MTTTLWDDSDQLDTVIPKIELMIIDSIVSDFEEEYQLILSKREEIRLIVMKKPGAIRRLVPNYRVVNGKYYNLVGYSNGETLIDISEYESISLHQTRQAVLMEHAENVQVLSAQRGPVHPREMYVNLTKEMNGIKSTMFLSAGNFSRESVEKILSRGFRMAAGVGQTARYISGTDRGIFRQPVR